MQMNENDSIAAATMVALSAIVALMQME